MPEIRYVREYTDGKLTAEIPYEVSDEQLAKEAQETKVKGLALKPVFTIPELTEIVKYLISKIG